MVEAYQSTPDSDIIPGLPADVARHCLTRVHFTHFRTLRLTSPIWKQELHSTSFHLLRNSTSLIALVHADLIHSSSRSTSKKHPIFRLSLFDPAAATWHPLPPVPNRPDGLPLFCHVEPLDHAIAVVGGWDPRTWNPTNEILVFDLLTGAWRSGARMPGPGRSLFGCCAAAVGGRKVVVAAGGHDENKDALRSALAYDLERDEWIQMPDMAEERDECRLACLRGKIWAVGGYRTERQGRFARSGEGFDAERWEWGPVEEEFLESETCPRACGVEGDLMCMCEEGHVAVREGSEGRWRKVAELPEGMRAALQVVVMEGKEGKRMVVLMGSGMESGVQVCYILEEEEKGKKNKKGMVTWRKVELPLEYSGHVQAACCVKI